MKNAVLAVLAGILLFSSQRQAVLAKKPALVPGAEAQQRVNQLTTEIPWYHSLDQAEASAQKQHKMVFWVQMLGDMAGAT